MRAHMSLCLCQGRLSSSISIGSITSTITELVELLGDDDEPTLFCLGLPHWAPFLFFLVLAIKSAFGLHWNWNSIEFEASDLLDISWHLPCSSISPSSIVAKEQLRFLDEGAILRRLFLHELTDSVSRDAAWIWVQSLAFWLKSSGLSLNSWAYWETITSRVLSSGCEQISNW